MRTESQNLSASSDSAQSTGSRFVSVLAPLVAYVLAFVLCLHLLGGGPSVVEWVKSLF